MAIRSKILGTGHYVPERVVTNALEDDSPHVRENNAAVLGELMSKAGPDARYGAAVRLLPSEEIPLDHRLDVLRMVRSMPAARVRPLMQLMLEEGALELVARRGVGAQVLGRPVGQGRAPQGLAELLARLHHVHR